MKKPKHTPGPWYYEEKSQTVRVKEWEKYRLMGDFRGCIVASLKESHNECDESRQEAEANARLIAASPDLLEALQKAVEVIMTWHGEEALSWNIYYNKSPEMKPIREAIEKATQ